MKAPPSEAGDFERFDAFNSDLRIKRGKRGRTLSAYRNTIFSFAGCGHKE